MRAQPACPPPAALPATSLGARPRRPGRPGSEQPWTVPCERAEMPDGLRSVRTTPIWDQVTMPAGLRHAHGIAAGTWGRIDVHDGRLRYAAATTPAIRIELGAGATQAIPPGVEHEVEPLGAVRFSHRVLRRGPCRPTQRAFRMSQERAPRASGRGWRSGMLGRTCLYRMRRHH